MNTWIYDKTFEGFLTLVFECFELKSIPDKIIDGQNQGLFGYSHKIITNDTKAERVWKGLHKKVSEKTTLMLYHAFLSEKPEVELWMLTFIRRVFETNLNVEADFGKADVVELYKLRQKVVREAQRILMFVRFQKTIDGIYYASFDPQYNVLPLAIDHFEKRFADQKWVIYDTRRNYGFFYDLYQTTEIHFIDSQIDFITGNVDASVLAEDEQRFQELWKSYFDAMCIKERINPKLHKQFLPKRFWKYLPEKQGKR
ncbi:MAG: TIGR03915 family putative DNA repair protein [Salinivirgaceae bacterium]|nr:TIGR03915 family putative DNA repair protein [Salinivirgaceae bacterium]